MTGVTIVADQQFIVVDGCTHWINWTIGYYIIWICC